MARPAAFLDRDGTLIRDARFLASAEDVALLPGAADAIGELNVAGTPVIVVTNQSGVARGYFGLDAVHAAHAHLQTLLAETGARIDAFYVCPHHPDVTGPCDCRKPGTELYRRAAGEHDLDLTASLYAGDRWRDVAPGVALGGTAVLVAGESTPADELTRARGSVKVVASLPEAVAWWRSVPGVAGASVPLTGSSL